MKKDVQVERKKYVLHDKEQESNEPCFIQFSKQGVTNLLLNSDLNQDKTRQLLSKAHESKKY